MTALRVSRAALVLLLLMICTACGAYYRPVATPITPNPPNPNFVHIALVVSTNGNSNPGASTTIDVSGDTAVSQSNVGLMPVHAALVAAGSRVFVANSVDDTVSGFSPSTPTPVLTISLPAGSAPAFVASTENGTVYVANSGSNTVSAISTSTNVVTNTIPVGINPVAMAETPNGQKLYVTNQGTGGSGGSVTRINTIDRSVNPPIANGSWISPVSVVSRSDGQRVYVLDKGTGNVSVIDTALDSVISSASVGAGANFMLYDSKLDRVYVTNPTTNTVTALDVSTDTLTAHAISLAGPVSVAALPDGTRVYVASAAISAGNVTSQVTVLNSADLSVKTTVPLASVPAICTTQTASELSIAAAADSSRIYVGNCDARSTAIIQTSNDTLFLRIPAPLSSLPPSGGTPPPQNPVFVLTGP